MAVYLSNRERPQTPLGRFIPNPKLKFMEQCREVMRFRRLALRSEQAYLEWIKRFIFFHGKRHPKDMGVAEVRAFLTHLANERHVSASTQNQAFNALLFLYRHVLDRDLEFVEGFERARRSPRVPVVLTKAETGRLLGGGAGEIPAVFPVALWDRDAADGGSALAGQRCGF